MQMFSARISKIFRRKKKMPLTERAKLGLAGEKIAADFLKKNGFRLIARNRRIGRDEIDIVARECENLVFIEVKTRTAAPAGVNDTGAGYFAVDARKRKALARACRAYMKSMRTAPKHFRFDIIEVKIGKNTPPALQHHRGVPLFHRRH